MERFSSGEAFLEQFKAGSYDLVFMDIYLGGINGVETVKRIRDTDHDVFIAFVTSSQDHAMEAYRLHVNRYLEKPVNAGEVLDILNSFSNSGKASEPVLFGKKGSELLVNAEDIVCIEQSAHQAIFSLSDGSTHTLRSKLAEIIETLKEKGAFYHCHKSFIVNISHVTTIDSELSIFHTDIGKNVHIRRGELHKARHILTEYRLDKTRNM